MDNNTKLIHEFYYVVGHKDFHSHYKLAVDRETEKMLYGNALNDEGNVYGRFSIKKENLDRVQKVIDRKYGTVYKVQVKDSEKGDVRMRAKCIIYNHLRKITQEFLK